MMAPMDAQKFNEHLLHFILDERDGPEDVARDLQRLGIDPEPLCNRVLKMVQEKQESTRLAWIEQADRERKAFLMRERPAVSLEDMSQEELLERFQMLLSREGATVQFRNAHDMTVEDLRSSIRQLEMLREESAEDEE